MIAAAVLATRPFVAAQESAEDVPGLEQDQEIARADTGVGQYYTAAQAVVYVKLCNYRFMAEAVIG